MRLHPLPEGRTRKRLVADQRLGLAPGVAFGAGGEGSIRICYASERHILEDAMQRLALFFESYHRK
jgi:hypothetical protein